jgi:nicotinamidase/pyrazinamidase
MEFPDLDVLLIVDVQNDFLPGGALGVDGGFQIIPGLERLIDLNKGRFCVVASRDWHPGDHCSFRENGGQWPAHCVQGTEGALLHPEVDAAADFIISKGQDPGEEEYAAYDARYILDGLSDHSKIGTVYVCGLALDYCVKETAMALKGDGWPIAVLADLTAPVDETQAADVLDGLVEAGVEVTESRLIPAL